MSTSFASQSSSIGRPLHGCVLMAVLLAACSSEQDLAIDSMGLEQPMAQARGQLLLEQYDCGSCHVIPGVRRANGKLGPSLETFAHRAYLAGEVPNEPRLLVRWIAHPSSLVPGTLMPDRRMPPAHASDMAAYLMSLR